MPSNIPFLVLRGGTLYFRRRLPDRHVAAAGTREWKRAIGKGPAASARVLLELRLLTEATDEAVALLERGQTVSPRVLETALEALYPEKPAKAALTMSRAVELYLAERGLQELEKPEQVAVAQFAEGCGKDRLDQINRSDVRKWLAWLRERRGQSPATVRRRLGAVRAIAASAMDADEATFSNPFVRHRIAGAMDGRRNAFDREQWSLIASWLDARPASDDVTAPIIRLLRCTGARPLEIGGLDASDLMLGGAIPAIHIRPNGNRGLKTPRSQRTVPLLDDGLQTARKLLERMPVGPLFPCTCHDTGALSARLNKALRSAGIPHGVGLSAYSFRHTLQEAMRVSDAPYDVQQAILGHAPQSTTDRYGAGRVSMARMKTAMESAWISLSRPLPGSEPLGEPGAETD